MRLRPGHGMPGRLIMMRRPGNDAPNERISLAGEIAHLAGGAVEEEREGAEARRRAVAVEDRDFPVDERVAAGLLGPRAGRHHWLGGVEGGRGCPGGGHRESHPRGGQRQRW